MDCGGCGSPRSATHHAPHRRHAYRARDCPDGLRRGHRVCLDMFRVPRPRPTSSTPGAERRSRRSAGPASCPASSADTPGQPVLSSLLQQGRSVAHCLEMLQRRYRAMYTQNERDFGSLTFRIGGPRLLHAANHAGCAPSRDQMLFKHEYQPIAYRKTIRAQEMLAVLPSKLPFCAYSIFVDELAVEGEILPSLVSGASPVLFGFCMQHAHVPEIKSGNDLLALRRQLAGRYHSPGVGLCRLAHCPRASSST